MSNEAAVRALMAIARAKAASLPDELLKFDQSSQLAGETAVLAALAHWFGSRDAIAATELPDALVTQMVGMGLKRNVVQTVGRMVLNKPLSGRSRHGAPSPYEGMPATRRVATEEPEFRAAYLLAAAKRLTTALVDGNLVSALVKERRYLDMHVAAGRGRRAAARAVDEVSEKHPRRLLVWRTRQDSRVDPRCAMLEGRLFTPDNPPGGEYPGAVHPRCRCYATAWAGLLFV
jgi:SPP1 gp7 family putative phage head morphogenesis protein